MSVKTPGAALARVVTSTAALGFVPVAIHFDLFQNLVEIGHPASSEVITTFCNERRSEDEKISSPLCPLLTHDALFAMAGLGLVDLVEDNVFSPNGITEYMVNMPSAKHGAIHFTTEPLFASAFLMRKLVDTQFEYPFKELETPVQYGYKLLGQEALAKEHTYSIMAKLGRMDSFNQFMQGKFGKFGRMPERVLSFGYDIDSVIFSTESPIVIVDIGGNQVLQEFNPDIETVSGVTLMEWNFKDGSEQPVTGALIYSLMHIFHNLSDICAVELMQKISRAMAPSSRLLIHEFSKNQNYGNMHSTMISLYGGRVRSSAEWHRLAALCALKVTFEAYPPAGEGLVEMRKVTDTSPKLNPSL